MDKQAFLERLQVDRIENLWVIYHDYSGRSCAKTVPKKRFASALEQGVVFARANLDFTLDDHQSAGAAFLADTGDFLAVPDPNSYASIPYYETTGRAHTFMRADAEGNPWEGCPRTQLERMVSAFEAEGLDAGRYAMFIHSTWTDEETGAERSRMGVRYSELLAFIIAAL